MLADMRMRLTRAGIAARIGLADSRGAAWALAHFDEGVAAPGDPLPALRPLPVAALRLDGEVAEVALDEGIAEDRLGYARARGIEAVVMVEDDGSTERTRV